VAVRPARNRVPARGLLSMGMEQFFPVAEQAIEDLGEHRLALLHAASAPQVVGSKGGECASVACFWDVVKARARPRP